MGWVETEAKHGCPLPFNEFSRRSASSAWECDECGQLWLVRFEKRWLYPSDPSPREIKWASTLGTPHTGLQPWAIGNGAEA